ncbi:hypothetical protein ACHJH3_06430 [Campylobacter sp. MOP7]|uniref:hypothetical protein n=1 Tax=Campylobacter canis TaxID=3378588 RepID=UPI00387ECC0F
MDVYEKGTIYNAKFNWSKTFYAGINTNKNIKKEPQNTKVIYIDKFNYSIDIEVFKGSNLYSYKGEKIQAIKYSINDNPTYLFFHSGSDVFVKAHDISSLGLGCIYNNVKVSFDDMNNHTLQRLVQVLKNPDTEKDGGYFGFYFNSEAQAQEFNSLLMRTIALYKRIRGQGAFDLIKGESIEDEYLAENITKNLKGIRYKNSIILKDRKVTISPADDFCIITPDLVGDFHLGGINDGIIFYSPSLALSVTVSLQNASLLLRNGFMESGKLLGRYVILTYEEKFALVPTNSITFKNIICDDK